MTYDCFTFFNEFDLLKLRLETLKDVVDKFIIVQANRTHSGLDKPYYLNQQDLKEYNTAVLNIDLPLGSSWEMENYQRNQLMYGIPKNADFVLIGDVDEIPDPRYVGKGEFVYNMRDHYWKWNLSHPNRWNGTVQVRGWRFNSPYGRITPQDCRNFRDIILRVQAGWHFSWSTDPEVKQRSFAHTELQDRQFDYTMHPCDGNRLIKLPVNETNDWPKPLLENPQRWQQYLKT